VAEVIISSDDLTVLGGPSSIRVDTSFGQQGVRGSRIFAGNGQPNDPNTVIGQTPTLFDLYINLLASDDEYLYVYQYLTVDSSNTWVPITRLIPDTYRNNDIANFDSGSVVFNIPLVAITSNSSGLTPANFNIQLTIESDTPTSHSLVINEEFVTFNSELCLRFTVFGVEYAEGSWTDFSGEKIVHMYISVV
jgi:hypothetical protein